MSETTASITQDLFIQNLRKETSESHQKLEDNPLSKAILSPDVTIPVYQEYLVKMYGVMYAVERDIFPILDAVIPDLQERNKAELIVRDLRSTGFGYDESALPVASFGTVTLPEALGIMYVLEGSTLGGRVLYKHIHEHLGLTPENGASFFWGYGTRTGVLWKSFIASFSQCGTESAEEDIIIGSATKTFTLIESWLSGN